MKKSKADKVLDKSIEQMWYKLASGVQVNIMDIPGIFRECRAGVLGGGNLEELVKGCIVKYRQN